MEQQNLKLGQKIFKIKILNYEIQFTNFLLFSRDDIWSLLALISVAYFLFHFILIYPAMLISLYFYPKLCYVYIPYCTWMILDRKTASTCGRRCRYKWFRKNPLYDNLKNYFSHKLIKTSELHPGQNYLLASYPHGVGPISVVINFFSDTNNITEVFPEIEFVGASHNAIFFLPLIREYWLALGVFNCDATNIKRLLTSAPSKGVILYPGGEAEMCLTAPGRIYRIVMSKRKGFIRLALMAGTALVPVFTFGEINIMSGQFIPNLLKPFFKEILPQMLLGDFILPNGRGIFQNHFGFIPRQHPVTTVVGKPISVPKIENPSLEIIDKYHKKFSDALFELFEEHKHTCDEAGANAQLIMV